MGLPCRWECPYLAAGVSDNSLLCLSSLLAEAALHGAPTLWHSVRHREDRWHCTAPWWHHGGTTAPLQTTTTLPLHGTMALLREAANATDRTRPTAPLENTKYLFSAICGLSETGRGRNKRSGTLMSHITVNHELWGGSSLQFNQMETKS